MICCFGMGSGVGIYLILALLMPKRTSEVAGSYGNAQNPKAKYGEAYYEELKAKVQSDMDAAAAAAEQAAQAAQMAAAAAEAAGRDLKDDADYIKAEAQSSAAFQAYKEAAEKAERVFRGDAADVEEAAAQMRAEEEQAKARANYEAVKAEYTRSSQTYTQSQGSDEHGYVHQASSPEPKQRRGSDPSSKARGTLGVALLSIGVMWILQRFFRNLPVLAIALIIVGIYILFTKDK